MGCMLFLISLELQLRLCLLPWRAGLYLLFCWDPLSPLMQAHFAFLYWPHPVSFITSTPPKVGGAPRSGVYTGSKSRKKDQRDPRERFPSLVLFIRLLLLPLKAPPCSTVAHCVSQGTPFSPVPVTLLFSGKRGECAEGEYECVETVCK